jgi:Ca2+-binding RTX toxin-like protein
VDHIEVIIGSAFNDSMFAFHGAETFVGGDGRDILWGADGDDVLIGGAGADDLRGDDGSDTISYRDNAVGVHVDTVAGIAIGGDAQGDTFDSIESIIGTNFNDVLVGGGEDAGTITGGGGDDVLSGGIGATQFIGGDGFDTVSYANSTAGVSINLETGHNTGGMAEGDRYNSIEAFTGSSFGDTMVSGRQGDAHYIMMGGGGDDVLKGGGIGGGSGTNDLEGGDGNDTITGGDREDLLQGGSGNDTISGGERDDVINGGDGDDVLISDGGYYGTDTLTGGAGADHFTILPSFFDDPSFRGFHEVIADFSSAEGDKIDISAIVTSFIFIGTGDFTGVAGQLRYDYDAGHNQTTVTMDRDGDGETDFGTTLTGHITLTAADFLV